MRGRRIAATTIVWYKAIFKLMFGLLQKNLTLIWNFLLFPKLKKNYHFYLVVLLYNVLSIRRFYKQMFLSSEYKTIMPWSGFRFNFFNTGYIHKFTNVKEKNYFFLWSGR